MKILHVLPSLDQAYGGPIRLVLDLSARCTLRGVDSYVVGTGELRVPDNPLRLDHIISVPAGGGGYQFSLKLAKWLRSNVANFTGVVLHGAWTFPVLSAARACRRATVPYGVFPHGMIEPWCVDGQGLGKSLKKRLYWKFVERRTYDDAACIFFTTERERRLANEAFSLPPRQALLPPYGIEAECARVAEPARVEIAEVAGGPFALFLSRIHQKKNIEFLLKAWQLAQPPAPWRLVVAGPAEPQYLADLKRLAVELGLSEQVVFPGFVAGDDKAYLMQQAAWLVLPSRQENFGVIVLEAIENGCPVAVSDQVYVGESLGQASEVMPLDLPCWVEFLRSRMPDSSWRQQSLTASRKQMLEVYSMGSVVERWVETFSREFGSSRGA